MGYATQNSFHDVRSDIRFPTDFRAVLHWEENFASVEIADIANGGIRFIGRYLPAVGVAVRIGAKGLDEKGRVAWRTDHSCGVMLERQIDALGVVRANCFPPSRSGPDKLPLDSIPDAALAETLISIFWKNRARPIFEYR
jgi:hypothetical protein